MSTMTYLGTVQAELEAKRAAAEEEAQVLHQRATAAERFFRWSIWQNHNQPGKCGVLNTNNVVEDAFEIHANLSE